MAATILFLLVAVLIARFSWQMPLVDAAERALYDARATLMAPHVEQDKRITLVTYNDETLFNTGIRSPLDRTLLANALANLDQMGAKAIGIDIAFDSPRPDDDALKAQLRAMKTPRGLPMPNRRATRTRSSTNSRSSSKPSSRTSRPTRRSRRACCSATTTTTSSRNWPHRPKNLPPLMAERARPGRSRASEFPGQYPLPRPRPRRQGQEEPVFANIPIDTFAMPDGRRHARGLFRTGQGPLRPDRRRHHRQRPVQHAAQPLSRRDHRSA